ncbi:MAG: HxsD-like protein [Candidatus Aenigmatarchaeota archaeon]
MKNVKFDDNIATVFLQREFYPRETVDRTIDAFSQKFDVSFGLEGEKYLIELDPKGKVDIEKLAYHFLNYVLSEMNSSSGNI